MENLKNIMSKPYHVYVLYDSKCVTPVYIGMTSNLHKRIKKHISSKEGFDGALVIESFDSKEDALTCERGIIKFVSIFGSETIINGLYVKGSSVKTNAKQFDIIKRLFKQ